MRRFAEEAGRDPGQLRNVAQLPLCIGSSFESATSPGVRVRRGVLRHARVERVEPDSAIRGTPEQCAEQIAAQIEAGVQHIVFCPFDYEAEQVQRLATEVLPLLGRALPGAAA